MGVLIVRNGASNGAKSIALEIPGAKRLTLDRLRRRGTKPRDIIINWGCVGGGRIEGAIPKALLNHPAQVANASNKLLTFKKLNEAGVSTLDWATDYKTLRVKYPKQVIFARCLVDASGGRGIKLISPEDREPPDAPLYTAYFKKDFELRVHVFDGEPIHVQQKRRKTGAGDSRSVEERMIRSHDNGWVFCETSFNVSFNQVKEAGDLAVSAVRALGLDFGAVDILGKTGGELVVCEVNTKPGIESTLTKQAYTNAISKVIRKVHGH